MEKVLIQERKNTKPTVNNISYNISRQQHNIYLFCNLHTSKTLFLKVNMLCIKESNENQNIKNDKWKLKILNFLHASWNMAS